MTREGYSWALPPEDKSWCYRVEPRKVMPGRKIEVGPSQTNFPQYAEYCDLWIIVEGMTERYLGRSSTKYPMRYNSVTDMDMSEYFSTEEEAETMGKHLHKVTKCQASGCGWKDL